MAIINLPGYDDTPPLQDGESDAQVLPSIDNPVDFLLTYFKGNDGFYSYLWCNNKSTKNKVTITFCVDDRAGIESAVMQAQNLNAQNYDIYFGVNVGSKPTDKNRRYEKSDITRQIAIVADIDIAVDGHHKENNLAPNIETAKKLLPITPTYLIDTGGGIHPYYKFNIPLELTNDADRDAAALRGRNFLDVIRAKAGELGIDGIDGVHDLPRILRLPFTYNCKDPANKKLCTILQVGDTVSVEQIDALICDYAAKSTAKGVSTNDAQSRVSDHFTQATTDFDRALALAALDAIPTAETAANGGNDWLAVNSACKNLGLDKEADEWSKRDPEHYDELQNKRRYDSLKDSSFGLHTLIGIAKRYGFDAAKFKRKWINEHPQENADNLKRQLHDTKSDDVTYKSTRESIPSCPVDLIVPGGFGFDEYCIAKKREPITSTPVVPTKILIDADSRLQSVELAFYQNATEDWTGGIIQTRETLANHNKIITLANYGVDIISSKAKKITEYLSETISYWRNYNRIPRWILHNRTGWIDDGANFILPSRAVDGHEINPAAVKKQSFTSKGDYAAWKKYAADMFNAINDDWKGAAWLVTFGAALAAPLLRPCNVRSQQIHLRGSTGKGKTSICKHAMSIYGAPEKLKHTFDATRMALGKINEKYNDLPVFVDELQSADKKLLEDMDKLIYQKANEKSRERCEQTGNLQSTVADVKNFSIYTGEMAALRENSNGGAYNRLLQLNNLQPLPPNINPHDVHIFVDNNHGFFGVDWINYIIQHKEEIVKDFDASCKTIKREVFNDGTWSDSWTSTFAIILTALLHGLPLIDSTIDAEKIIPKFVSAVTQEVIATLPTIDATKNGTRALNDLQGYVAANPARFQAIDSHGNADKNQPIPFDGFDGAIFKDGAIGFYPYKFRKIVENTLGYPSATAILDDFASQNLLQKNIAPYKTQITIHCDGIANRTKFYIFNGGVVAKLDLHQ